MNMLHLTLLLATVSLVAAQDTSVTTASVSQVFKSANIVPQILPTFNPTALLNVVFQDPATKQSVTVTPGMNVTVKQATLEPTLSITAGNGASLGGDTFVVVMFDPDAPTPQSPTFAQYRHLLAEDLKASVNDGSFTDSSPALTEYLTPGPPAGSDPHRYIVLLYTQTADFATNAPKFVNSSTPRDHFSISTFAEAVGLGSPIAENLFYTGPDNSKSSSSSASSSSAPGPSSSPSSGAESLISGQGLMTGYVLA